MQKILLLTQGSFPDIVKECLRSGGSGFVQKMRTESDLLPAIDAVLSGRDFVTSGLLFDDSVADAHGPCRHEILFCRNEEAVLNSLAHFIGAALIRNNAAIVWATMPHRDSLIRRLRAQRVDVDAAFRRAAYISSDVSEEADPVQMHRVVTRSREAASKAGKLHPRVSVCGERAGRLWAEVDSTRLFDFNDS